VDAERALIRRISAEEVRSLRHRVLRPGQSFDQTVYPGDEAGVHLGAFDDGNRLVGISSLYREDRPGGPSGGWRLRGMATADDVRGHGYGAALLAASIAHVDAEGGTELWCNARIPAAGFYRRAGFDIVSEEFEIAGIGPHVVMTRRGSMDLRP
jgi:predicted GNAT family N-acyltransferase